MDGWVVGGDADVRYSDVNGVTLDKSSLDVYTTTGAWASVLTLNLLDPNNADALAAFRANTKITRRHHAPGHRLAGRRHPPWNGTHLIINTAAAMAGACGPGLPGGLVAEQRRPDGHGHLGLQPAIWAGSQFDKVTWCSLEVVVNANSADYAGWVWFYIDNMKFGGGGIP